MKPSLLFNLFAWVFQECFYQNVFLLSFWSRISNGIGSRNLILGNLPTIVATMRKCPSRARSNSLKRDAISVACAWLVSHKNSKGTRIHFRLYEPFLTEPTDFFAYYSTADLEKMSVRWDLTNRHGISCSLVWFDSERACSSPTKNNVRSTVYWKRRFRK